jgi:RNA polymerase sigma-70 factor, ECF subfamily
VETATRGLDRAEVERLFTVHERAPVNVVYRWVWNRAEAAEIVQEAFVRLWKKRRGVERTTARALIFRIAVNLAASRRRRHRRWLRVLLRRPADPQCEPPEASVVREQTARSIRSAIERLPEAQRRVVVMTECSDLSYAEVARSLGIPEGTVASRRHHALRRLRQMLEEEGVVDVRP